MTRTVLGSRCDKRANSFKSVDKCPTTGHSWRNNRLFSGRSQDLGPEVL
jgi:hypothetical protein